MLGIVTQYTVCAQVVSFSKNNTTDLGKCVKMRGIYSSTESCLAGVSAGFLDSETEATRLQGNYK